MFKKTITLQILAFVLFIAPNVKSAEKAALGVTDLEARGEVSPITAQTFSEQLRTELVNSRRFTVVDRQNMNKILEEQKLQMAGCTDFTNTDCAVQFGRLLAVQKMLVGSITKIEERYIIDVKIVDVEKGVVEVAVSPSWTGSEGELVTFAKDVTSEILSGMPVVGRVTLVEGDSAYANIGSEDGIKVGDELEVVRRIEKKNPRGELVMVEETSIGNLTVVNISPNACEAIVKKGCKKVYLDDFVKSMVDMERLRNERLMRETEKRKDEEREKREEAQRMQKQNLKKVLTEMHPCYYLRIQAPIEYDKNEMIFNGETFGGDTLKFKITNVGLAYSIGVEWPPVGFTYMTLQYSYQHMTADSIFISHTGSSSRTPRDFILNSLESYTRWRILPSRISPYLKGGFMVEFGNAPGEEQNLGMLVFGGGIDYLISPHMLVSLSGDNVVVFGAGDGDRLNINHVRVGIGLGLIP